MDGLKTACTDGQIAPLDCLAPCVGTGVLGCLSRRAEGWLPVGPCKQSAGPRLGRGPGTAPKPPAPWGPISGKPKGWERKGQATSKETWTWFEI